MIILKGQIAVAYGENDSRFMTNNFYGFAGKLPETPRSKRDVN